MKNSAQEITRLLNSVQQQRLQRFREKTSHYDK